MTLDLAPVTRTRGEWRATARLLRTVRPELAAKITLARLADPTTQPNEPLTIAFSRPEYACLLALDSQCLAGTTSEDEVAATMAEVEAFLGYPASNAGNPR